MGWVEERSDEAHGARGVLPRAVGLVAALLDPPYPVGGRVFRTYLLANRSAAVFQFTTLHQAST